jgi:hypothetical protein
MFHLTFYLLLKDSVLEDAVIRQIARCAIGFEFEGSAAWNERLGPNQIGLHLRESTAFAGGLDTFNMECLLAELDTASKSYVNARNVGVLGGSGVKYTLVLGNEYGSTKAFSTNPRPDEVSHVAIVPTMSQRAATETFERIQRENVRFEKSVYQFLTLIKPFSFN